jgi:hypothetical protein
MKATYLDCLFDGLRKTGVPELGRSEERLVLSRFSSGYLIAILSIKETEHGSTIR